MSCTGGTLKPIHRLDDLCQQIKVESKRTVAVAAGQDPETIEAVARAVEENVVNAILVGKKSAIMQVTGEKNINPDLFQIVDVADPNEAAVKAVSMVSQGEADMLMKGMVKTAEFMRAILDKEMRFLPQGSLLSHVAVIQVPTYPKLLIVSDAAIVPVPTLDQTLKILEHTIEVANALGIEMPRVALISASESISTRIQSSLDAAVITSMARRNQISGAIVDGPLALDVAISKKHCRIKGVDTPVDGEADILIFPNIEAANTFYKSTALLAGAKIASLVAGTRAPVVLTSRADDDAFKFASICLAARLASKRFYEASS
jgi:phosphate butyryltransferase